jgi:hypothetical protein
MPVKASSLTTGVGIAIQAGQAVAETVAAIHDKNQRRQVDRNLAFLSTSQKDRLEKELLKTSNVNERIKILVDAITKIKSEQSTSLIQSTLLEKTQKEKTLALVVLGGALLLLIGVVVIKKL